MARSPRPCPSTCPTVAGAWLRGPLGPGHTARVCARALHARGWHPELQRARQILRLWAPALHQRCPWLFSSSAKQRVS